MCARPYRLAWKESTRVFELEKDISLLKAKRRALSEFAPRTPVVDIAADISQTESLREALLQAGFDTETPTDWIAEGLMAYLPISSHSSLFATIYDLSSKGSRFIGSNVSPTIGPWFKERNITFPHVGRRSNQDFVSDLRTAGWSRNVTVLDDGIFHDRFSRIIGIPVSIIAAEYADTEKETNEPEL